MHDDEPRWLRAAALPAAFLVGGLVTVQSAINGELADRIGDGARAGLLAATVSFGSGLLVLTVVLVSAGSWRRQFGRFRVAVQGGELRSWQLLGGLGGASLVAAQGLTVTEIGVALFVVAVVAGQSTSALGVDHAGLAPTGRTPVTAGRGVGAGLTVLAVAISSGLLGASPAGGALALAALPLVAGAATSVQQAVNAQVARRSSPWIATWNNFLVGTVALLVTFALTLALPGRVDGLPEVPWLYIGGLLGIAFIASAAMFVRTLGVLVFGLTTIAGQVVSAIAVDLVVAPEQVTRSTYLGGALTLAGVAVAAVSLQRERARESRQVGKAPT